MHFSEFVIGESCENIYICIYNSKRFYPKLMALHATQSLKQRTRLLFVHSSLQTFEDIFLLCNNNNKILQTLQSRKIYPQNRNNFQQNKSNPPPPPPPPQKKKKKKATKTLKQIRIIYNIAFALVLLSICLKRMEDKQEPCLH